MPVISAEDGQWLMSKPFTPIFKPGGHGAIWKLAHDKGVFKWFYGHGRKGATIRQVRYSCSLDLCGDLKTIFHNLCHGYAVMLWLLQMSLYWLWLDLGFTTKRFDFDQSNIQM